MGCFYNMLGHLVLFIFVLHAAAPLVPYTWHKILHCPVPHLGPIIIESPPILCRLGGSSVLPCLAQAAVLPCPVTPGNTHAAGQGWYFHIIPYCSEIYYTVYHSDTTTLRFNCSHFARFIAPPHLPSTAVVYALSCLDPLVCMSSFIYMPLYLYYLYLYSTVFILPQIVWGLSDSIKYCPAHCLACPALSYIIPCVLYCTSLSCVIWRYPNLSRVISNYPTLSHIILRYSKLSYTILHYPALSHATIYYPALSHIVLFIRRYPALSYIIVFILY